LFASDFDSTWPEEPLARFGGARDDRLVEPPISHRDVTTIMRLLTDIQLDVREIRDLLGDDDGEEPPEADT
jgi:hypothetical protein